MDIDRRAHMIMHTRRRQTDTPSTRQRSKPRDGGIESVSDKVRVTRKERSNTIVDKRRTAWCHGVSDCILTGVSVNVFVRH